MRIHTSAELREIDRHAAEVLGVPTRVLMENAGRGVADIAMRVAPARARFFVVCGRGNNGGDGWVAARHLHLRGRDVQVVPFGDPDTLEGDVLANAQVARACGVKVVSNLADALRGDVVVDALFGTGLSRPVEGDAAELVSAIGAARSAGAKVLSVDVPSGVDADRAIVPGPAVLADLTVTLHALKPALVQYPAREYAGRIEFADIGLPPVHEPGPARRWIAASQPGLPFRRRAADSHKGTNGHVLVLAGSPDKSGAAMLACRGAFRAGAGLVTLASAPEVLAQVVPAMPEVMSAPLPTLDAMLLLAALDRKTALVAGPGLGVSEVLATLLTELLSHVAIPAVLDADALNALAANPHTAEHLVGAKVRPILTPHPLELARLLGTTTEAVQADRLAAATEAARRFNAHVVLKGACSVVAHPDGSLDVIGSGTPAMGTAGAGDVLAGICGAFVGQGLDPGAAAVLSTWAHGQAGAIAARGHDRGIVATDIADALPTAFAELT